MSNRKTPQRRPSLKLDTLKKVQLRQSQKQYVEKIINNEITFCAGPAGTSKTFTACYTALQLFLEKKISQVVLCKPIQEAGEKLGFLPGDVSEKIDPFMTSYISNMKKIIGDEHTQKLVEKEIIVFSFKPTSYLI